LRMQAKVVRAVQEGQIDRIGGSKPVRVNVRIVATTNRDIHKEVRLGRFRADLLFQLNVITLKVPPLRERPADVSALAEFFAGKFGQANGRPNSVVSPRALARLQQHDWPGNVRELENVMHRAVLMETGPMISSSALAIDTTGGTNDDATAEAPSGTVPQPIQRADVRGILTTTGRTIEAVEKEMILDTLCQCKGNRSQAATVLGISVRTLRNKLHEYERAGTRIPRPVIVAVS
jgi:two-component system, response regulator FlrC